ncbi:MAG: molybdopterin cofactor-binding domain-containing protein, partial [Chloroflexota bacterium]
MRIQFNLNGQQHTAECRTDETLMAFLRRSGLWSVKHGCETGDCGACSVLVDGKITPTCVMLAGQVDGRSVTTLESLNPTPALHPIQQAFADTGAIQCGYCTPAMILAAKMLLDREPNPSEEQVRETLSAVLCRCTGYVKPVESVMRAAAMLRGETVAPVEEDAGVPFDSVFNPLRTKPSNDSPEPDGGVTTQAKVITFPTVDTQGVTDVVGKSEIKVDAVKLAKGKPAFVDDITLPGMLYAAMLTSPHAHARIKSIDASEARALEGVRAVLTHQDVQRVIYASGGQTWPNPKPWDQVSLDSKVRHVGDRVAVVAAETPEIAAQALKLIKVEYEILPAVFDAHAAMKPGAPVIHDEADAVGVKDAVRNLATDIHAELGDMEKALQESDHVYERTYNVHQVQQAHIEPHICITYWDEDDRLVIRTSTQVPFHVRRMVAPLIGLPIKRIRVVKPRIGGGFGAKQEMLIED